MKKHWLHISVALVLFGTHIVFAAYQSQVVQATDIKVAYAGLVQTKQMLLTQTSVAKQTATATFSPSPKTTPTATPKTSQTGTATQTAGK